MIDRNLTTTPAARKMPKPGTAKLRLTPVPTFIIQARDLEKFAAEYGIELSVPLQHPNGFAVRASGGLQTDALRQRAVAMKTATKIRDARFFILAAVYLEWLDPGNYTVTTASRSAA